VEDENATTLNDVDAHTRPTTTSTERRPTTPEDSISTTSTTTMNEPLGKDIEQTTSGDQTITVTGVVPDKKNDTSIVFVDSKLAIIGIYLSGSSLALVLICASGGVALYM
jgi:hypothetical protein